MPAILVVGLLVAIAVGVVLLWKPWQNDTTLRDNAPEKEAIEVAEQESTEEISEQEEAEEQPTPEKEEKSRPVGYISDGKCGDNTQWFLTKGGVLTISGTGDLGNWSCFREFGGEYEFSEWEQEICKVIIEDGITEIGDDAFAYCGSLEELVLPKSMRKIGKRAFRSSGISSVVLNEGLEEIGEDAFRNCGHLESIEIPSTVRKIGEGAFSHASALETIEVVESNPFYKDWYGTLLTKDGTTLLQHPAGHGGVISCPEGITHVAKYAFYGCRELIQVEFPASLEKIGLDAFDDCPSLNNILVKEGSPGYLSVNGILCSRDGKELVTWPGARESGGAVPEGVETIKMGAFDSGNLTDISFPGSLSRVETAVFSDCVDLKDVYYEGTWEEWEKIVILDYGNDYLKWSTVHTK